MNPQVPPADGESPDARPTQQQQSTRTPPSGPVLHGSLSRWGPTSMGIDPAVAAGLAYLFGGHVAGILPIVWLIAEKRNRFIRFHAMQALLGIAAYIVGMLVAAGIFVGTMLIASAAGADNQTAGGIAIVPAVIFVVVLTLGALACDIWGLVAGFSGKFVKLPLIGGLAVRLVGGPPVPLY